VLELAGVNWAKMSTQGKSRSWMIYPQLDLAGLTAYFADHLWNQAALLRLRHQ
jgi:hypothetical protein